jgi:hypothetical protein
VVCLDDTSVLGGPHVGNSVGTLSVGLFIDLAQFQDCHYVSCQDFLDKIGIYHDGRIPGLSKLHRFALLDGHVNGKRDV